jgi:hypothetical protein
VSERDDKHSKDFHELSGKEGMEKIASTAKGTSVFYRRI